MPRVKGRGVPGKGRVGTWVPAAPQRLFLSVSGSCRETSATGSIGYRPPQVPSPFIRPGPTLVGAGSASRTPVPAQCRLVAAGAQEMNRRALVKPSPQVSPWGL